MLDLGCTHLRSYEVLVYFSSKCLCMFPPEGIFASRDASRSYYWPSFTFPLHLVSLNFLSHIYRLMTWISVIWPLIVFLYHCSVLSCYCLVGICCGCHSLDVMCFVAFLGLLFFNFRLALLHRVYILMSQLFHYPSGRNETSAFCLHQICW